jgi:outer membrane protein assembly factor BamB
MRSDPWTAVLITACLFAAPASAQEADLAWNQWRGADRTGRSPDTGLSEKWADSGPSKSWKTTGLGEGFSSVSFAKDRIFTMGDKDGAARMFALDAKNGKVVWTARVGKPGGTRNPGPRSTPSTDGELVFGLGHDGALVCVRVSTGKVEWRRSLQKDFGGRMMSGWGFSESPLLDGDMLVCTPGGKEGTVLAFEKATGKVKWRCTELKDRAGYCSLVPVEIAGVRQYLVFTGKSLAGVAAKDGKLLWRGDRPGKTAICSCPIYHDGFVFVSSGYKVGCNAFRIKATDGTFDVEEVYAGKQLQSHHGGMVRVGDHVYGLGRRNLKCIELKTGKVVWEDKSVGKGSITFADGHLIVRGERRGSVALVEATPEGYKEKGRFEQPDRTDAPAWAYPVVFGGKLYIRDQGTLFTYDVTAAN